VVLHRRFDRPKKDEAFGVAPGVEAVVRVPEIPGRDFPGKVTRIADALQPGTRTLLTEIDAPNPDHALSPGVYCNVELKIPRSEAWHALHPAWRRLPGAVLCSALHRRLRKRAGTSTRDRSVPPPDQQQVPSSDVGKHRRPVRQPAAGDARR
jgi:multidrug efflux pump subunit AcrA (membrane-fusion protein)